MSVKVPPPPRIGSSKSTPAKGPDEDLQPLTKTHPHGVSTIDLQRRQAATPSRAREKDLDTPTGLMGPREESGLRFPQARMERAIRKHWAGEVVRAILPGAHEPVQVLALPSSVRPTRKVVEGCVAAGRRTAKVRGHGVARFVELLRLEDGRLGIATEPIEGESLADHLDRSEMRLGRAVGILRQLAHVLRIAQKARLSHGSLCIDALWLTRRDDRADALVVADFGLDALMEPHLQDDTILAPYRPYSPERLLGLDRAHEDVYLFGCVAHHLLAGIPVFAGAEPEELRRSHSIQDVPPVRRIASDLLGPIAVIVDRCLANDPNERYDSFSDVEAALCLAQVDTGLRTMWDDLPLPAIPSSSRRQVEDFFGPRPEREVVAVGGASPTPPPIDLGDVLPAGPGDSLPVGPAPMSTLPTGAVEPIPVSDPERGGALPMGAAVGVGMVGVGVLLVGLYLAFGRGPSLEDDGMARAEVPTESGSKPGAEQEADQSAGQEAKPGPEAPAAVDEAESVGPSAEAPADDAAVPAEDEGDGELAVVDALPDPESGPIVGHGPSRGSSADDDELLEEEGGETGGDELEVEAASQGVDQLLASASRARRAGKTSKAIKLYRQVLAREPKNRKALPALGDLYFNRSDYKNSAKYFKKAVVASPSSSGHRLSLGDAYYKLGRYADAKKQYEKAKSMGSGAAAKRIAKVNKKLGG